MLGAELSGIDFWWLFPVVMVVFCFFFMRRSGCCGGDTADTTRPASPRNILDRRDANGEIDDRECDEKRAKISGTT